MREPISRDSVSPRELADATRRLDRALEQLEAACAARASAVTSPASDEAASKTADHAALERDRARLAAELDVARTRESELESAAAAASQALGRAAAEVRAALGEGQPNDGQGGKGEAGQTSKPDGDGFNEEAA